MAISKDRLEELIKQGATIWNDDYGEIKLNNDCEICEIYNGDKQGKKIHYGWLIQGHNNDGLYEIDLNDLEEDVELGEFKHEFQHITRTEELNLPTFEFAEQHYSDKDDNSVVNFIGKNKHYYGFILNYNNENITICELANSMYKADGVIFYKEFNKENYIKACKLAKALFLGEKMEV
jgi:hypothetical protein